MVSAPKYMFLLVTAQTPVNVESNIEHHAMACEVRSPGVVGPFALHITITWQPMRPFTFLHQRQFQWRRFEYAHSKRERGQANDAKGVGTTHSTDDAG